MSHAWEGRGQNIVIWGSGFLIQPALIPGICKRPGIKCWTKFTQNDWEDFARASIQLDTQTYTCNHHLVQRMKDMLPEPELNLGMISLPGFNLGENMMESQTLMPILLAQWLDVWKTWKTLGLCTLCTGGLCGREMPWIASLNVPKEASWCIIWGQTLLGVFFSHCTFRTTWNYNSGNIF